MKQQYIALVLFGLIVAAPACAQQTYTIRTMAGAAWPGDGGLARNAVLDNLGKMAVDAAGNVYFAEQFTGRIRKVNPGGLITTIAGGGASTGTQAQQSSFYGPYPLVLDNANNNLFVGETFGCHVWRIGLQTGIASIVAGNGICAAGGDGPALSSSLFAVSALALDSKGGLLIGERYAGRVRRLDPVTHTLTTVIGGGAPGSGDGLPPLKTALGFTEDIKLDAAGDIFVADLADCVVRELDSSNTVHIVAGQRGNCGYNGENVPLPALLGSPYSIAVDPSGSPIYVAQGVNTVSTAITVGTRISRIDVAGNNLTTYAGDGLPGDGGDGGPATKAQLGWATGLAFLPNGNLLLSEYSGQRIRYVDSSQHIQAFAGALNPAAGDGGPAQAAFLALGLSSPSGTALDGNGGLVINDSGNNRVRSVSNGVISRVAGSDPYRGSTGDGAAALSASLDTITGMAVDPAGPIYVAEFHSGEVRVVDQSQISQAGSFAKYRLPTALALDPTHSILYIDEFGGGRVVQLNLASGTGFTLAGFGQPGALATPGDDGDSSVANQSHLRNPRDLAVDAQGNVYVMDSGNSVIRKINPGANTMVTVAGNHHTGSSPDGSLATAGPISITAGITVDSGGNIFYVEGAKIRRIDASTHTLSTIAGTTAGFSGDGGPALKAQLSAPTGLSVDSQGNIYMADNGRIRVLSPASTTPLIASPIVAANYGGGSTITPGTWVEIYGINLSPTARQWAGSDFSGSQAPDSLDNVKVLIGGKPAYLDYISGGQVNAQVPDNVGPGNVTVQVTSPNGASNTMVLTVASRAPAILAPPSFTANGEFYAAAQFPDLTFVGAPNLIPGGAFRKAKVNDVIVIYGIGFGPGTPAVPPGTIDAQLTSLPNFTATIGGVNAPAVYAGLAANFVGLYQFDITVPAGVSGDALLQLSVDGVPLQQTLFLALQ